MTADEIRQRAKANLTTIAEIQVDDGRAIVMALMTWLPEIAAQLAELNRHLSSVLVEDKLVAGRVFVRVKNWGKDD